MKSLKEILARSGMGGFRIDEFLTRSEGPQLFTTAINDILIAAGAPEVGDTTTQLYREVPISRRDITFPSIRGINPDLIREGMAPNLVQHRFTSVSVTPQKFGLDIGITNEMLEDNEVGLMGWRAGEIGRSHRELDRREGIKALSFFSTGPAVTTGVVGIRNHGVTYVQGGYTNFFSGTANSWEGRVQRAIAILKVQTITVGDQVISFPVTPDTIVANPTHEQSIRKVLNANIVVISAGLAGANLPGSNIFNGIITNQVYDPTMPTGQAFVLASKRGLAKVTRVPLSVDEFDDRQFDVTRLKTRTRYLHAVIEELFICDIQIGQ